jgi:hypothetical protein
MATEGGRLNGFQQPRSKNQTFSWGCQVVVLAVFYPLACFVTTDSESLSSLSILLAHFVITLLSIFLWYYLETHDPAEKSCWGGLLPDSSRWTSQKYCRIHKKKIEGLDHFCEWLNVSIGRSNYVPFLLLVSLGLIQFMLQIVLGVIILVEWSEFPVIALIGAIFIILFSGFIECMYLMLFTFHIYLACKGMSTYDYTVAQSKKFKKSKTSPKPLSPPENVSVEVAMTTSATSDKADIV